MKVTLNTDAPAKARADLLAVAVGGSPLRDPIVKELDAKMGGALKNAIRLERFDAKPGQSLKVAATGIGAKQVLLVGVPVEWSIADARQVAVTAAQAATSYGTLAIVPLSEEPSVIRAIATGAQLGAYRYTTYLTGERVPPKSLGSTKLLVSKRDADLRTAVDQGTAVAESVNHARDLVNAPPNDLHPVALADFAQARSEELGIECQIWDKAGIQEMGMNLFLAVNAGSGIEPRMIHMTYRPEGEARGRVVFVGKGLTFDAGGLCLKPAKSMGDMKCDMAGAATTIGIVLAAARLKLPIEVHGIVGSTENMLGENAYRPGDVFVSKDGKSVEIINTDAEGRLVLADVLAYARELKPDILIDHATLTGACMVALGPWTAGLFTDDDEVARVYTAAAQDQGEAYWRLPLDKNLRDMLNSDVADLKHTGEREGGAITAALFLREFVGDCRWMHLDIAGPAFLDRPHRISPKGGTGFGVMTGVRFLESL